MLFRTPTSAQGRPSTDEPDPNVAASTKADTPRSDPLAASLTYLAAHHGRAVSREALLGGLPILDGRLSVALYDRAARRAGLRPSPSSAPLLDIPALVLPAVLIMKDGTALILFGIDTNEPKRQGSRSHVGTRAHRESRAIDALGRGLYRLRLSRQGRRRSRCARSRRRRSSAKSLVLVGRQAALAQLRPHRACRLSDQHARARHAAVHHERLRPRRPERRDPLTDRAIDRAWASPSSSTLCFAPCEAA